MDSQATTQTPPETLPTTTTTPAAPPQKNRLPLLTAIIVVSFALFFAASVVMFLTNRFSPRISSSEKQVLTPSPSPEVFRLKASVKYLSGSAWKLVDGRKTEIRENDILLENDTLMTDSKSRLVLSLDDGSVVRLDENTTLALSDLKPENISLNNQTGVIFARVQKDPQHKFLILAKNVVVESTGTAFLVENKDEVKVLVYENAVKVSTPSGQLAEVKSQQQWSQTQTTPKTIDTKKLASKEFAEWSLQAEKVLPTPSVTIVPIKTTENISGIILSGKTGDKGISLEWKVMGIDTPKGFKVVKSDIANPVYPGSEFVYLSDASVRSYTWNITDGKKWHFRICQYTGSACGTYSNDVQITAPTGSKDSGSAESKVSSISLTAIKNDSGKAVLEWSVTGTSGLGFKIVWSRNSDPVYPTRDGDQFHYLSDPSARRDEISGLESGKTYYFRVCEYLGGKCGTYSNQTSLSF